MRVRRLFAAGFVAALTAAILLFAACDEQSDVIDPEAQGPPAPQWSYVSTTASEGITLEWTDVATGEVGFIIYRSLALGGFTPYDTVAADVEEYEDQEVTSGTPYYYQIRTRDPIGRLSDPTPALWAIAADNESPDMPSSPSPANKSFDLVFPGLVTLTWEGGDTDSGSLTRVVYFGDSRAALAEVATDLPDNSYTLDDTLARSRFYFWRVRITDDQGATALSPTWSFGTKIERIEIPAGHFFRGDCGIFHPADPSRFCPPENPTYAAAFDIDKFEVTNQLYAQFLSELIEDSWIVVENGRVYSTVGDTLFAKVYPDGDEDSGIRFVPDHNGGVFVPRSGKENHPAIEVTWHGARRFAHYYQRRLPTEVEWEKAARGTTSTWGSFTYVSGEETLSIGLGNPYPWGATPQANYFNYVNSGDPFESRVDLSTTPVGYYDGSSQGGYNTGCNCSPYGVYDLAGNAAEWCEDEFVPYQGGSYGGMRLIKGGGWRSMPTWCQVFWRQESHPDSSDNLIGFRTAAAQ
ncbi:MAG: SUMF1/EgtB/PvdO family nonheme iron enzyme [Candidatus Eisenbacteria sp.]|nr:SUMF1/EgtB/PvdO family nonheme iron enzyme [Candidatus Eisenbacteria bacterium]